MLRQANHVGGEHRESDELERIASPYDGEPVGEVFRATPQDVEDALVASVRAFDAMRRLPTHRRAAILAGTARLLEARAEELAVLMARESGKPIRFARGEVARAVVTFDLAAGEARAATGEVLPVDLEPRAEGRLCLWERVPRGPVVAIAPFNFPLNLIAHKVAPAVAVGTSTLLKPPPQCPLTAFRLAELLGEAGLPAGALSVLHCAPEVAQRMVEDPRPRVLSFTGSDAVGWRLERVANRKQVLLELGGNAPCVVDEDVELEEVLGAIVAGAWAHAGQVCIKVQRLYVHASLFDAFLARFVEATEALAVGDPLDEGTVVGPMIEERHVERVLAWIEEARAAGATVHCGARAEGQVVWPTILTGADPELRVCREEVFGPVTVLEPFDDFDEVLERCNRGRYGLQAGVFTRRTDRALRAWRTLEFGGVMINDVPTFRVDNFPYGGVGDSGTGREGVRFAMQELCEPKVLVMR